jgi:hypothetical protein
MDTDITDLKIEIGKYGFAKSFIRDIPVIGG